MKRFALAALLLLSAGIVTPGTTLATSSRAAKPHFPVTIVDDLHNVVHLAHQPMRIISLDPRDTETLFSLGLGNRVVADGSKYAEGAAGISHDFRYPSQWPSPWGRNYPVRSKKLPHIEGGYGTTPFNLELIESLHPDLILSLNTSDPTLQKMRDLGLKVVVLDPANLKGIFHDISLVGKATGTPHRAQVVVRAMKRQLQSLRRRMTHVHGRPNVYYEIDATNPTEPYTAGPGTFIDQAIQIAGGKNAADGVKTCSGTTCYPQFSLEALVRLNPKVIVLGDATYGTTVASVKQRSGWGTISAVQAGKIYPFDDELISRAGPRIIIGIQRLARLIHPEAFRTSK
jgi:iron complex transport system substrate-binding protein